MVFEQEQSNTINVKYSKLDGLVGFIKSVINYKAFVFIVILLLSSRIDVLGYHPIPYVMLAVATVFKLPLLLPGVISLLSMIITKAMTTEIVCYVLTYLVYTLVTVVINVQEVSRKVAISIKMALSMSVVSLVLFVFKRFNITTLVDSVALIFLVQALYYIYIHGLYFLTNIDRTMIYSTEEIVSMAVMIMITLTSILAIKTVGVYIWTTIAIVFAILIGYTGGIVSGLSVSIVLGFLGAVITGDINLLLVIAIPGVISSVLNRVNKTFAILGVIITSLILGYIINRSLGIYESVIETIVASLVILILPKKITVVFEDIFNKNSTLKSAYEKELGVGSDIKNKLSAMSEVFDNLSSITLSSNKEYYEETERVIEKYLTDYKESKCLGCNKRYYCLKENLEIVSSYIARKLEDNAEITENMLPVDCEEAKVMIKEIKDIYNNMKLMRIIKKKEEESNTKLAMEYKEVAKLIKNMAREIEKTQSDVSYTQKCIRQELKLLGYEVYEDSFSDDSNITYEFITDILDDVDSAKSEIQNVIGEVIGQKMSIKLILNSSKNEKSRIKLVSDGKYSINSQIYQKAKSSSEISGDTYYISDIKNGKVIALSDGMGSGEKAKEASSMVISMLEKLLLSGFNNNTITKIINNILKLKEESNVSASLDMTIVNTSKETVQFLKKGAPPTYVIYDSKMEVISKNNFPLGISDIESSEERCIDLVSPMLVINISDGAYSEGLEEYLEYISKKNIDLVNEQEVIDGIMERISDTSSDDITIIVTKIE